MRLRVQKTSSENKTFLSVYKGKGNGLKNISFKV